MWVMMTTPMPWRATCADHVEAAARLVDAERGEGFVEQHQLAAPVDEAVELDGLALAAREVLDLGAERRNAGAGVLQRFGDDGFHALFVEDGDAERTCGSARGP
jgi:hypothetical protein